MVKENFIKYVCDSCKEELFVPENDNGNKFPTNNDWIILSKFKGETGKSNFFLADKDFCCEKCLFRAVGKVVRELDNKAPVQQPSLESDDNFKNF